MKHKFYDNIEHKILTKLFSKDALTENYDVNDVFIEYKDRAIIGEFKSRHYSHTYYNEWFLEKDKYEALLNKVNKQDKQTSLYYINYYYNDRYLIIWDLKKVFANGFKPVLRWQMMNKHSTQGFKYNGVKERKQVYMLKNEWAKVIIDIKRLNI